MRRSLVFLFVATALLPAAFAGNIVQNPGFESGNFTGWTASSESNGWTVDTVVDAPPGPHSGTYYADTGCVGATCISTPIDFLFQSFTTTPGTTYTFSFWYDLGPTLCSIQNGCSGGGSIADDPTDDFAQLKALWGSTTVLNVTSTNSNDAGYVFFTINEMATASTTQIEFMGRQDPSDLGVDDVCVDVAGGACSSAVPEPASLFLVSGGLAGLGFVALGRRLSLKRT